MSTNFTDSSSSARTCDEEVFALGEIVGGVVCALFAGLFIASSMVLQRWALTFPEGAKVPFLCFRLSPSTVWTIGMLTYQVSQLGVQLSMVLAPLSLCTAAFTLLLVWNVILSRHFLGERPSRSRVAGALVIVAGSVISIFGVPPDACNRFRLADVHNLFFARAPGGIFAGIEFTILLGIAALVYRYDRAYSIRNPPPLLELEKKPMAPPKKPPQEKPPPPVWMDDIMVLLSPVALALQEGFGAIFAKSLASIIFNEVFYPGGFEVFKNPLWYVMWVMGVGLTSLSVVFLKLVYARYEVTTALPIEYGTVHFCQIMAGLLFFEEYKAMSPTQFVLYFLGLTFVLIGVGLSSELHLRHKSDSNGCTNYSMSDGKHAEEVGVSRRDSKNSDESKTGSNKGVSPLASPSDSLPMCDLP